MITKMKAEIKRIDDDEYLATVTAGNAEGENHGNLGRVCKTIGEAVTYVKKEIDTAMDKLAEKSGKLPFDGKKGKGEKEEGKK